MLKKSETEKKQKRTCFLPRTRCTEKERLEVEEKANKAGLSLSEYQRQASLNCIIINQHNLVDLKLVNQLSAIGNNLNQLVRKSHIHDEADSQKIHDTLTTIDNIVMGLVNDS